MICFICNRNFDYHYSHSLDWVCSLTYHSAKKNLEGKMIAKYDYIPPLMLTEGKNV